METPEGGSHWRLVELRPVSEGGFNLHYASAYLILPLDFADPPLHTTVKILPQVLPTPEPREAESIVPITNAPTTLMEWAVLILNTPDPILKV